MPDPSPADRAACVEDTEALWRLLFAALARDPENGALALALAHVAAARDALATPHRHTPPRPIDAT